ncbi:helix-turn-helix transcriptional regulator [Evansella tamaricis]|uniref:Helix-turn-helix domain-containing protein n=1 Tax=Evansella tamaricis TaxID=2069301 RepID=A0ABS6JLI1_9BACI|nr:helix-turn-helix transcriptional regulator [Evansella tamaricis]MBU9714408.1 helix-turn-helix domain-containing protein [Evansella tamaricis]
MFKNKIEFWMKERGLIGKFVYTKVGVSEPTFISWKKNKKQPDLEQSYQLAKVFNISIDDLCEEIDE